MNQQQQQKQQRSVDKCKCHQQNLPAQQTLSDLEFDRGIWNAAIYNDLNRVRELIGKGHAMDRDNCHYTALHYAARSGHKEVCELLIKEGHVDVNAVTKGGVTPLHRASMKGHLNIVKLLIEAQANVNVEDEDGQTALHRAAMRGHYEICKLLLDINPNLKTLQDKRTKIPFEYLDENSSDEITLLLKP